jgi:transcriptional regulator with XRE-family HTH domain
VLHIDNRSVSVYEQTVIPDPLYKEIGATIRNRRKTMRLSQEKLAARLQISRGSLANIEIGRQNLLVHQLYKFAAALDLKPSDLLPSRASSGAPGGLDLPLPGDLRPNQKAQIVSLFSEPAPAALTEEVSRAKSTKR